MQWKFNFNELNDFDGLVHKCLSSIAQYRQTYAAPRAGVSQSLDEMITKGFPSNEKIIWHKRTNGQRRYYWLKKANDEEEVRVKVGAGVLGKADRDLKILSSSNECQKIVRQFLVRWEKLGSLPGWKTIWSIFDVADYDVSERRIKAIYKIIQKYVTRELLCDNDVEDIGIESLDDRSRAASNCDIDREHNKNILDNNQSDPSHGVQQPSIADEYYRNATKVKLPRSLSQPSSITNEMVPNQVEKSDDIIATPKSPQHLMTLIVGALSTTSSTIRPSFECEKVNTNTFGISNDSNKENDIHGQMSSVDQIQQKLSNTSSTSQLFSRTDNDQAPSTQVTTPTATKKKRQRRVYAPKTTPYATRQKGLTVKETK